MTVAPAASPGVGDLAWLAGTWAGKMGDTWIEETWMPPGSGAMVGVFRWHSGDAVRLYELLSVATSERGLVLRLRHFSDQLEAWEEKDKPMEFVLESLGPNQVSFATTEEDGTATLLKYEMLPASTGSESPSGASGSTASGSVDRLKVSLIKRPKGGEERRTTFEFERR